MRLVLLLIAAAVAVVAGVAALQLSGNKETPPQIIGQAPTSSEVSTIEVLVARQAIPVGTVLDESLIDRQPWPSHLVLEGFVTADTNLSGKVARAPFQAREPFLASKLANPNDPSFLAASLPEGMRAITIATDAISGIAGYVFPGDRVDVLLTHSIPHDVKRLRQPSLQRADKPQLAEVLAANVRVLAVNVRALSGKEAAQSTTPTSITLEVGQAAAQKIRLAEKNGTLSLSLRSIKDQENNGMLPPTPVQRLSQAEESGDISQQNIRIVRGAGKENDEAAAQMGVSLPGGNSREETGPVSEPIREE